MKFKHVLMTCVIVCFLISIASVNAVDKNATEDVVNQKINLSNFDSIGNVDESQSFDDLRDEIENATAGTTINLKNNYYLCNATGPIVIKEDNITVDGGNSNCILDGNASNISCVFNIVANNVVLKNIKFINFKFEDSYDIIEWFGNNGTVNNCYFINNTIVKGTVIDLSGNGGIIESCYFENNFALDGGALYIYSYDAIVRNSKFINNQATDKGGAIFVNGKNFLLQNSVFENCSSNEGGAIYIQSNNDVVFNCTFKRCFVYKNGGAVCIQGDNNIVTNCYLLNNSAMYGGGIYLSGAKFRLNNSYFNKNYAFVYGGAIFTSDSMDLILDSCEYIDNSALSGGAIYALNGGVVNNSIFYENYAFVYGGAIYAKEIISVDNSLFNENYAITSGAALFLEDYCEIIESNFTENIALNSGGAILTLANLVIEGSNFKDNGALDGSNNIALMSDSIVVADNKTTYDFPLYLQVAELNLIKAENITYGDTLNVVVYATFMSKAIQNGTVLNIIDGVLYSSNVVDGYATFNITKLKPGNYSASLTYISEGFANSTINYQFSVLDDALVNIVAKSDSFVINYAKSYSVELKDSQNNPISGRKVTFILNGKTIGFGTTNKDGMASIKITSKILKNAKAGTKKLTILVDSTKITKTINIKINKEKTKLVAKKKTFKVSKKIKKYSVRLKNSKGKAIRNAKLTLKIKGKTYKAKTNKKGKATFKITKLNKKNKFKAVIKFKANNYYKAVSKKVNIITK